MPISNGANSWPKQYWHKPASRSREPKVVIIDRPYEPPIPPPPREPTPPPKIVYVNRPRTPPQTVTYVTRPETPPPPPRQVTIVKQPTPQPQTVTVVRQRSPSPPPVEQILVERQPSPKPVIIKQTPSPQLVTYLPPQPEQVTYVQPNRPTYIYAPRPPSSPVATPRTVYVEQPPPDVIQPIVQTSPQYSYVPVNARPTRATYAYATPQQTSYTSPQQVYQPYYGPYDEIPPAFGQNRNSCAIM